MMNWIAMKKELPVNLNDGSSGRKTRRDVMKIAGTGLTVALAGCGEEGEADDQGGDDGNIGGGQTSTGGNTPSGETVKVGALVDLSGSLAALGEGQVLSYEMAIEEMNNRNGVNGQPVELVTRDTETQPDVAVNRARELIQEENVDIIFGGISSATSLAIRDVVNRREVVAISPSAASRDLSTSACSRYMFTMQIHNKSFSLGAAPWALENLGSTMEIIYMDFAYGQNMNKFITNTFEEEGGTVTGSVALPLDASDMSSYLSQINRDSDIFFVAVTGDQTVNLVNQSHSLGVTNEMSPFGITNFTNYAELNPDARTDWYSMTPYPGRPIGPWDSDLNQSYREDFEEQFGSPPWNHPAQAYSTARVFERAANESGFTGTADNNVLISQLEGMGLTNNLAITSIPGKIREADHNAVGSLPIIRGTQDEMALETVIDHQSFIDDIPNKCTF
jgi:branched-chain amino acid transport system substrate-binding protein